MDDVWQALADPTQRPRWVQACVEDAALARQVLAHASTHSDSPDVAARALAVTLGRALLSRVMARRTAEVMLAQPALYYGHVDTVGPEAPVSLALSAVRLVAVGRSPGMAPAHALLRAAMQHDETRREAYLAVAEEDADAAVRELAALLAQCPDLASAVGTLFALRHTSRCEDAARAVAPLPESTRVAFAGALHKHLDRVHAIKRWVACRRLLLGR